MPPAMVVTDMSTGKERLAELLAKKNPERTVQVGRSKREGGRPRPAPQPSVVTTSGSAALEALAGSRSRTSDPMVFQGGVRQAPCLLVPGNCRDVLSSGPEGWADAIICDPGVGSTSQVDGWLNQVPGPAYWSAMLRAAKPGSHMAVFAGRRTMHRVMTYAEDSGWEIRDTLMWVFAKGMPMSLDIGQAIDRKMGGDGEPYFRTAGSLTDDERAEWMAGRPSNPWYGWGTELRPSWEPIVLMRKPLSASSIAQNVIECGVGAINIDASRIDSGERDAIATHIPEGQGDAHGLALQKEQVVRGSTTLGRWPANVIWMHDYACSEDGCVPGCVVAELDDDRREPPSRYFWCPKAARREKDLGLGHKNAHKAVRPAALSDWLIRLICPGTGLLLDPFAGTCTFGMSAVRHAGGYVGIDTEESWLVDGHKRILSADRLDTP